MHGSHSYCLIARSGALAAAIPLILVAAGCGDSPSQTAPTPPSSTTRIIGVEGSLDFGSVMVGDVRADGRLVISNSGNASLTVTGITFPGSGAYTSSWTSGTIAPGGSQNATITFMPTAAQSYSGTLTVNGDQTSGTNTLAILGVGLPAGRIRFLAATLQEGSTVTVAPLGSGQQATQLAFSAAVTLDRDLANALVRAWVRTPALRCMGGGLARVTFQKGREQIVTPASMSNSLTVCTLPYDTTHVEIEVIEGQTVLVQDQFPIVYRFVRAP